MSTQQPSSPDQQSSVYPDRFIRPLPKRSIRSRLSQEAAQSITYPPNPPSTNLPSYALYSENGEYVNEGKHLLQHSGEYEVDHDHDYDHDHDHDHDHEHQHDHDHEEEDEEHCSHHHHHCHHDHDDDDFDSVDESSPIAARQSTSYRSSPHSPRTHQSKHGNYGIKTPTALDGYEAFENTNNKKKRKIPTSGNLGPHHSSLTGDIAAMGLSSTKDNEDSNYYGSPTSSGLGMQGAGRGRNGRRSGSRNPLGVSVNGANTRLAPSKYDQNLAANAKAEEGKSDQGIISTAIANATALLRNPLGKGQENIGVLDQQTKTAPANSQFTFTCESEAKGVKFPEQSLYSPDYSHRGSSTANPPPPMPNHRVSTQATQTSPSIPSQNDQQMPAPQHHPAGTAQTRKPRRRKGDVYALAARQRKLQQEYMNLQHPPTSEDIWICEFCEYESIFGEPPRALIRQYEIKDRRERKRLAEKQRLLEKAKMKGRKAKKQTKNAAKAANHAAQQTVNQQAYDQQSLDAHGDGDDYIDDGYDDDPSPEAAPPLPQPPAKPQTTPGTYGNAGGRGERIGTDRGGTR